MTYYALSAIFATIFKDGVQPDYPVWENVYLVKAADAREAFDKAEAIARSFEGDSNGSYTCDGRPATLEFVGIRKCITSVELEGGFEVSYSEFEVATREDLMRLANGEDVIVKYYRSASVDDE